jgi:hypothetical protein
VVEKFLERVINEREKTSFQTERFEGRKIGFVGAKGPGSQSL